MVLSSIPSEFDLDLDDSEQQHLDLNIPPTNLDYMPISIDLSPFSAQYVLPSDYPTAAPYLFSKSLRAFFSKRISGFNVSSLQDHYWTTSLTSTKCENLISSPNRMDYEFTTSEQVTPQPICQPSVHRSFSIVPERFDGMANLAPTRLPLMTHRSLLICEHFLIFFACLCVILSLPFSLLFCLRVVPQYERAVVFRLGRLISKHSAGPGLIFVIPCLDTLQRVDLRTFTFNVPTQEVLTRDSVTVVVNAVVYYRIFDPAMSVVNVKNVNCATRLLSQTTLRNVLGTVDMYALLTEREQIAASMQVTLDAATDTWGMKVERVEIKDVRLPLQLQRTLAAEAEATREAKAMVIAAEGEKNASRLLKEAAREFLHCPGALQLRCLQTLSSIASEHNSTIIFPLPLELLHQLKSRLTRSSRQTNGSSQQERIVPGDQMSPNEKDLVQSFQSISNEVGYHRGSPTDEILHEAQEDYVV